MLELLVAAQGRAADGRGAAPRGRGTSTPTRASNVVKVTISRLRRKLGDPPAIETVPHAGYRIRP